MSADNKGPGAVATTVTVTCIASVIVLVRLWIRMVLVRASGWDDWIITIAMAGIAGMTITISQQVKWGLGRHIEELDEHMQERLFFCFWLSIIFYNIGLGMTKISIIMQYLRIFATTRVMRVACLAVMTFTVLYTLEAIILSIFSCTPVDRFWQRSKPGTCVNFKALWFTHAALNIFSDVMIISLPMPVIRGLNVPKKQKFALMGIFALGAFGCVTSILRLRSLYAVADSTDTSYDNVDAAVWSNVEINVAIMCASLPTFKALVKRLFPHVLSTDPASRSTGNKYGTGPNWRSRNTRQHGTLISLDGLERGDAGRRRGDGLCTTTIEKGHASYAGSDGESSNDDGIKVTTVVSQREDSSSDKGAAFGDDVHSVTESERKFFPNS
ncbi:Integral membrane protein [Neofusicoccum parvum]|uniref:Putative integral membrane protein n=1 Tax=Botryosphaeria parva (strain UCR-NP2) TaxID=1287680 RepID=R1EBW8_BOTPV|nr:putative integral membrane protein [Neofusicoccum parvum UCRNP2]GME62318.1 Integral membrane protein [Neofusicoccum parvum]